MLGLVGQSMIVNAQIVKPRCTIRLEYRQYCFEGRDCGREAVFSQVIDCPEEVIDSGQIPVSFDTIRTYRVINYNRLDVRNATPNQVLSQIYLMFDMEKIRTDSHTLHEGFTLFWDSYFDNAHNLSGRAFIAMTPKDSTHPVAVQFGTIGMYDVIRREKVIGSPWSDKNPGGTGYYDEDGREILRLIYGN